jgi:hypothetical protein
MRCTTFQDGSNWSILEGVCEPRSTPSSVKSDAFVYVRCVHEQNGANLEWFTNRYGETGKVMNNINWN